MNKQHYADLMYNEYELYFSQTYRKKNTQKIKIEYISRIIGISICFFADKEISGEECFELYRTRNDYISGIRKDLFNGGIL